MTREEYEKCAIETEDKGRIYPQYNFDIFESTGDYVITKSAQEVYNEIKIENKPQPTEEQQLLSTVLLENAEIKEQLKEQQELSATLTLQIAQIKGGNANV